MHRRKVCIVILSLAGLVSTYEQCMMPNRKTGQCRPQKECDPVYKLNKKFKKTQDDLQYLFQSSSSCSSGTESDFQILFCCPPERQWGNLKEFKPIIYDPASKTDVLVTEKHESRSVNSNTHRERNKSRTEQYPSSAPPPECGQDNSIPDKIQGGNVAEIDQFPWLVLLEYGDTRTLCGGSLISTRYVLTAAHCIKLPSKPAFARLGEYNTTSGATDYVNGEEITVDRVPIVKNIAHPNYTWYGQFQYDIGLSKLSRDAVLSAFVSLICLPSQDLVKSINETIYFTVAGWGTDGWGRPSEVKKYVNVPFVPLDRCRGLYRKSSILDSQICAGGIPNEDACAGDSGGPLMYKMQNTFLVVGVVSYGLVTCGTKSVPSVYTYVYSYTEWLRKNMV